MGYFGDENIMFFHANITVRIPEIASDLCSIVMGQIGLSIKIKLQSYGNHSRRDWAIVNSVTCILIQILFYVLLMITRGLGDSFHRR
jgi:hypothetical protein